MRAILNAISLLPSNLWKTLVSGPDSYEGQATPLHVAAKYRNYFVVDELKRQFGVKSENDLTWNGALCARDVDDNTPLHLLCSTRHDVSLLTEDEQCELSKLVGLLHCAGEFNLPPVFGAKLHLRMTHLI